MISSDTAGISTGQAVWAWMISLVLATSLAVVFYGHAPTLEERVFDGVDSPVIVIGSSLMLFGISPSSQGSDSSLLGDGRAHTRLGVTALKDHESLGLLRRALETGVQTIVLEANTFVIDLQKYHRARQRAKTRGPWETLRRHAPRFFRPVRAGARALSGLSPEPTGRSIRDIGVLDDGIRLDPGKLNADYPLIPHPLRYPDEMRALVRQAGRAGIEIILVAPPRPRAAADILGPEVLVALAEQITGLAADLELPLFRPGPIWPNEYFADHGHLNYRGRLRFMSELAAWSMQRQ